jgi:RNA polymerase sigma-70 factor (ECF subfamily)
MDDIEHEVKISVWKEIQKSEKEIRNLGSYIWRVTYTTTSKIMKRLSEQRWEPIDSRDEKQGKTGQFETGGAAQPDYQFQNEELFQIVRESVNLLIESRRQVVKLYLSGMNANEIAEFLGWTDGKTRNLLSRGLADLRKILLEKNIEWGEPE